MSNPHQGLSWEQLEKMREESRAEKERTTDARLTTNHEQLERLRIAHNELGRWVRDLSRAHNAWADAQRQLVASNNQLQTRAKQLEEQLAAVKADPSRGAITINVPERETTVHVVNDVKPGELRMGPRKTETLLTHDLKGRLLGSTHLETDA